MQEKGPEEIMGECWLVSCCYKKSTISEMSQEGKLENTHEVCYHCSWTPTAHKSQTKGLQLKYHGFTATGKCFEHFESPVCRARKLQVSHHSGYGSSYSEVGFLLTIWDAWIWMLTSLKCLNAVWRVIHVTSSLITVFWSWIVLLTPLTRVNMAHAKHRAILHAQMVFQKAEIYDSVLRASSTWMSEATQVI